MRVLVLLLLVGGALPASAQVAFVQAGSIQNNVGTIATPGAVTAGSLLVLCAVVASAQDGTVTGVTDTQSNAWALADRVTLSNRDVSVWYAMNATAGTTTATVSVSGTLDSQHMVISEYSGLATSGALGATSKSGPTNSTSSTSGNVVTTSPNAVVVGCTGLAFSGVTYTATNSFTHRGVDVGQRSVLTDRIVSSTGSYAATGTLSPTEEWGVIGVEFKAPGGGGGTPTRLLTLGVGDGGSR